MLRSMWLPGLVLALGLTFAGCSGDDDDSSPLGEDDASAGDDDASAGDDDATAGDDDATAGDDDATAGDDDATMGGDDASSGDDDASSSPMPSPTPSLDALCHWDGSTETPGPFDAWWQDRVFYEVFVRSFKDSDPGTGAGSVSADGVGDLKGLISRLDYLNDGDPSTDDDLGVTGLWLMPVFDSPSVHGYDVTDYYRINPDYGTEDDLKTLLEQAHQRGIAVILDLPFNHSSSQHPWFLDSESSPTAAHRNWYVWSSQGTSGYWHQDNGSYYYAAFDGSIPDFNYYNADLRTEMASIYDYWLELGLDGYRLDGVKYLVEEGNQLQHTDGTHCYLEGQRRYFAARWPDRMLVGEIYDSTLNIAPYFGDGTDQLPLAFDFSLSGGIIDGINRQNPDPMHTALANRHYYYPADEMGAPFLRNHDMDRTGSVLSSDEARKLAAVGLFSMPGTPFMYYGEEIGMTGVRGSTDNDDNRRRTPMQWSSEPGAGFTTGTPWYPINADYVSINVEDQQGAGSLLSWYRTLIRLRHEDDALRRGGWAWVKATPSTVYAFLRGIGDGAVLVVMNFKNTAAEDVTVDLSPVGSWESGGDLLSATTFSGPLSGVVNLGTLPGYSARWIKMHQAAEAR